MAAVTLDAVVLNRVRDPSEYVRLPATSLPQRHHREGQVRTYAGGYRRAIIMEDRSREIEVVCERAVRADVERLESWIGQPLLYRDTFQQLLVGVVFNVSRSDAADIADDWRDRVEQCRFMLHEVSYTYGV